MVIQSGVPLNGVSAPPPYGNEKFVNAIFISICLFVVVFFFESFLLASLLSFAVRDVVWLHSLFIELVL